MSLVAAVRPDSWNLPLFVHVLGAMILVGGVLTSAGALTFARGDPRLLRLGYWTLLAVAAPGWVIMRVGAQWIYSKGWDEVSPEPDWLGIGWIVSEGGGVFLLASVIVGGAGVHRLRAGKGGALLKLTLALSVVMLGGYLFAVWAMAGKPG